jgi:hypothetical protein
VDGRAGNAPLAGVRVVLAETGTQRRMEATTFSDGGFSFIGVKPGTWTVAVDPRDLATLKGSAAPAPIVVRSMENGDRIAGIRLAVDARP